MPKKIRVYELARELGLTNKEALDICIDLGIGVKSHSSSIEDAQADRARRKADREGLRRAVQPEEAGPGAGSRLDQVCRRGPTARERRPTLERTRRRSDRAGSGPLGRKSTDAASRPAAETVPRTHEPRPGQRLVVSKSTSEVVESPRTSLPRPPIPPPPSAPRTAPAPSPARPGAGPQTVPGANRPAVSPPPGTVARSGCAGSGSCRPSIADRGLTGDGDPACSGSSGCHPEPGRYDGWPARGSCGRPSGRRSPSREPLRQADPAPSWTTFAHRSPDPAPARNAASPAAERPRIAPEHFRSTPGDEHRSTGRCRRAAARRSPGGAKARRRCRLPTSDRSLPAP